MALVKIKRSPLSFKTFGHALVLAALVVGTSSIAVQAAKYKSLKSGSWSGGVYINGKTGKFKSCVMSVKYKSGIKLLFSVSNGMKWQMGFAKNSWKLNKGEKYPVLYRVDKAKIKNAKARAVTKSLAVVNLPGSSTLFKQMRKGRLLQVKAGDDILSFRLTGSNRMLSTLLKCARYYNGKTVRPPASANSNPFEKKDKSFTQNKPTKTARSGDQTNPLITKEARKWYKTHLASSDNGYQLIRNEGKAAKMYKKNALVWRLGKGTGIIGTLRIYPSRTTKTMQRRILAFESNTCKGDFASRRLDSTGFQNEAASRLMAICRQKDGVTWSSYYALFERHMGGSQIITIYSRKSDTQTVQAAGERLTGTLQTSSVPDPVSSPDNDDLPDRDDAPVKNF